MEGLAGAGEANQDQPYPPGFRFRPTDEELVQDYLIPMMENRPLPFPIPTLDVYGTEPSRLPMDLTYSVEGEIYCFARRSRRSENGTRAKRTVRAEAGEAMSGTWHANSKPESIIVGDRVVAMKRLLSFQRGGGSRRCNSDGGWIMHEYCLEDSTKFQELVLCMIRNRNANKEEQEPPQLHSPSPLKRLRAAASTSEHAEGSLVLQQAPKGTTAASDAGGEGALTAAPRASGSTVHLILANPAVPLPDSSGIDGLQVPKMATCRAPTAPVRRANSAVDPDALRRMCRLARFQMDSSGFEIMPTATTGDLVNLFPNQMPENVPHRMLRRSAYSPGPQAPPEPEGTWQSPSPVVAAPSVPAYGHWPDGPNTPDFCFPPQTLTSMSINALPPATRPEQGLACRTGGCSRCLRRPWGMRSSSVSRMQDLVRYHNLYLLLIDGVQRSGERRDDAGGEGDASASESEDRSGGMDGGGSRRNIRDQANYDHSDYNTKSCD